MSDLTAVLLAVISSGVLTAIVTNILTRRKLQAETGEIDSRRDVNEAQEAETFADAISKFMTTQDSLQNRNRQLYEQIVSLEKNKTESERTIESLADRLEIRDSQIQTINSQLQILQDKDRQGEISAALVSQQKALLQISASYQDIIQDREQTIKELKSGRTAPLPTLPEHRKKVEK